MASGAGPISPALRPWGAWAVALGVAGLVLLPTAALWGQGGALGPADLRALRFTVVQAALSAVLSAGLAVPVARALARRRFGGRGAVLTLMGAPFLMPVIVAVIGVQAVWGRSGWVNAGLAALGLPAVNIYGLQGVLLAHVLLNLPLAVRMLLGGWQAIPAERFRLAQTLGLGPGALFRHLERPMLVEHLPGVVVVVFLICLNSFVIGLTLGGGPKATMVELAIYQAIRFDFDLGHAAVLALVQFGLCILGVGLAAWVAQPAALGAGLGRMADVPAPCGWRRAVDAGLILAAVGFLALPFAAVIGGGIGGLTALPASVWRAAGLSLVMALGSAALATGAALVLALAIARGARGLELAAMLPMAASGLVMGTGIFVLLRGWISPDPAAVPVTVVTNAALGLPFGLRLLLPEARRVQADYGRLAAALGMEGRARRRWLDLPRLARPLGLAAGLSAALAMGDLGVIALFAGERSATLPLMIQRLAGAYRLEDAAAGSVLLIGLSFGLYAIFDLWGRRHATA